MPLIKSAKKKMRQDLKRTKINKKYKLLYLKLIDQAKKAIKGTKKEDLLKKTYSAIDKAVKKKVILKNKGNRLKRKISKLISK